MSEINEREYLDIFWAQDNLVAKEFIDKLVARKVAEARRTEREKMPPEDPTTEMIERGQRVSLATGRALNDAQVHDIWQAMYDEWQSTLTDAAPGEGK